MLGILPSSDTYQKYVKLGPSFLCAAAGSLTVMVLTFLDCLACSRNYRKIKKIVNETSDSRVATNKHENDSGQTTAQQRVTINPYEIDSEDD